VRDFQDGDFPFANDFNGVVDAQDGTGIKSASDCKVTDGGSTDLDIQVAAGTPLVGGKSVSVSQQTLTLSAADSANPRYDTIEVDSAGTAHVLEGTPASSPVAPTRTKGRAVLAMVRVGAGVAGVSNVNISDARVEAASSDKTALAYSIVLGGGV